MTSVTGVVVGAREIDGVVGCVTVVVRQVEIADGVRRLETGVMVVVGALAGTVVRLSASKLDEFLPYIRKML
ncbi:hypothetical protein ACOSQ3_010039 [Xanthoceras sorbifolium]